MQPDIRFSIDKNAQTVIYVDANNLLHRAFHAAAASAKKENNPNIPGLAKSFLMYMAYGIKQQFKNTYCFAIFDGQTSLESRLSFYPEYKANRKNQESEHKEHEIEFCQYVEEIFQKLGYNTYTSEHIEADDTIGILAVTSANKGWNVICVSSDKDYRQLCQYSPNINIYSSQSDKVYNQKNFVEQCQTEPSYYVDYLAMLGDTVDNIPGVMKVGEKTAVKLITEYGSIDDIYVGLQNAKDSVVKRNFIAAYEDGTLSRNEKLIRFHFDNDVFIDKKNLRKSQLSFSDINSLNEFCKEHHLDSFREKYLRPYYEQQKGMRP